ncbi:hypothetical protein RJT34_32938 [Clitoria ternatea]|uniref:RING-type domain-containing protein n=1 Tax=Clitoria ternatea TaxID=43366 RepID=A0AAN9EWY8_CLITE
MALRHHHGKGKEDNKKCAHGVSHIFLSFYLSLLKLQIYLQPFLPLLLLYLFLVTNCSIPIRMPPTEQSQSQPKPKPNLLSLFLKPIIMLLLTSLFFLFLGFAAFLLLHVFLLGGAFHRLRSRPSPTPSNGVSPRDINKLPRFRLSNGSASSPPDSNCVVCLDSFRHGQWCRSLAACGHVFHRRCIDTWLLKVAACPTCRTPVRLNSGAPGSAVLDPNQGSAEFRTCATNTNALSVL